MSYADFFSDYDGTINDKEAAFLAANEASSWGEFFDGLEVPEGAHEDRLRMFLMSYLELEEAGQTLGDLWELVDGPYQNEPEPEPDLYGPPLTITTSTGSGPFTLTNSQSKRTSFVLEELEVGVEYRIDFDIVEVTGGAGMVDSDLADSAGGLAATPALVQHYSYITPGRFTYDNTYRFVDVRRTGADGTFTVENLTLRKVL